MHSGRSKSPKRKKKKKKKRKTAWYNWLFDIFRACTGTGILPVLFARLQLQFLDTELRRYIILLGTLAEAHPYVDWRLKFKRKKKKKRVHVDV